MARLQVIGSDPQRGDPTMPCARAHDNPEARADPLAPGRVPACPGRTVDCTARTPAHDEGEIAHDDVVIHEVMVTVLDGEWWADNRAQLRIRFQQEELVVRAQHMELL